MWPAETGLKWTELQELQANDQSISNCPLEHRDLLQPGEILTS